MFSYLNVLKDRSILKSSRIGLSVFLLLVFIGLFIYLLYPILEKVKNPSFDQRIFKLDAIIRKEFSALNIPGDHIKVQTSRNKDKIRRGWTSYLYEINLPSQYAFSDIQDRFYRAIRKVQGTVLEVYHTKTVFITTLGIEQTITHTVRFIKESHPEENLLTDLDTLQSRSTRPTSSPDTRALRDDVRPQVAIIIDDVGYNEEVVYRLLQLGERFTYAILPYLEKSAEIAQLLNEKNQEIILHIPMEPEESSFTDSYKGALWTHMSNEEIRRLVQQSIQAIPYIKGVSNHMGSRFTSQSEKMRAVLDEVKKFGLFFLDSRTTVHTVGYALAKRMGIKSLERNVFLDDEETLDAIRNQLRRTVSLAVQNGKAIAIGHPRPITVEALRLVLPEFKKKNIEIVSLSRLIE
jgi:hypothetical protein